MNSPAAPGTARQQATRALLRKAGIMPVVTVDSLPQAIAVAGALARGGLNAIEVTLRTAVAMEALGVVKREVPHMLMGAGTVITPEQARAAVDKGADFLVTPGTPATLAAALSRLSLPVVPGAATATEIIALLHMGFDAIKLFPAQAVGGLAMIKSLAGPFPNLVLCPTGGINEANAAEFLRQPNVACIGGSWMVPAEWVAAGRYDEIEASARRACEIIAVARSAA